LNLRPLEEIECYGTTRAIAYLLGFRRGDLAVRFGL